MKMNVILENRAMQTNRNFKTTYDLNVLEETILSIYSKSISLYGYQWQVARTISTIIMISRFKHWCCLAITAYNSLDLKAIIYIPISNLY